jgi:hypothetical protein
VTHRHPRRTGAAVLFAAGCLRMLVGIMMDEITVLRIAREQKQARGPANRDAREVGRTTDDDGGVW